MKEYYYTTYSFAAPFVSDQDSSWISAETPIEAILRVVNKYNHPCKLYALLLYKDANAKSKDKKPLGVWLSNDAYLQRHLPTGKVEEISEGKYKVGNKLYEVENPFEGKVYLHGDEDIFDKSLIIITKYMK